MFCHAFHIKEVVLTDNTLTSEFGMISCLRCYHKEKIPGRPSLTGTRKVNTEGNDGVKISIYKETSYDVVSLKLLT